jgi:hypothetical protein
MRTLRLKALHVHPMEKMMTRMRIGFIGTTSKTMETVQAAAKRHVSAVQLCPKMR